MLKKLASLLVILSCIFYLVPYVFASNIPSAPTDIPIVDNANILSEEDENSLAALIATEEAASSSQIAVLTINTLDGAVLENYALEVAREWKIGTEENDNGVLLLVALHERKIRIEVGKGLEGALPDARARQIIDNEMVPYFRSEKYAHGIHVGVQSIIASIQGEYTPSEPRPTEGIGVHGWAVLVYFGLFTLQWISAILARSKSWHAGGIMGAVSGGLFGSVEGSFSSMLFYGLMFGGLGALFDYIVSNNYKTRKAAGKKPSWWAGGAGSGSSKSSGSSGWSGGGGSFGGGGATGGW